MTTRRVTPEEAEAADAWSRQWWRWFLSLGLLASRPEYEMEAGS